MKNIYLYGASDDCNELDTDFGKSAESYSGLKINDVLVEYDFDGDWGVALVGNIPKSWKVYCINGNTAEKMRSKKNAGMAIHIQVPDEEVIEIFEPKQNDDGDNAGWKRV